MSFAIAGGVLAGLGAVWGATNASRSRTIAALRVARSKVRRSLTEFALAATDENSIADIVALAGQFASTSFGAHRLVLLQEEENGWVASQPTGPPPPPVPTSLRGLFGWFKHNPLIACEADLGKGSFGAMRSPLKMLMDTYAIDVVMPLVHQDGLLAVVGMAIDRKPSLLDRELLRIFRLEVTAACTNVRLHHKASHLFSLAEEVAMANNIELAMVPQEKSGALGPFEWSGHFSAAGKASSDFWGIYPLAGGSVMVVIGDSVGSDLAGTMVSAVLKSCCDQVFDTPPPDLGPGRLLSMLNDSLFRPTRPALASCSAVVFDANTSTVTYANAGHLPPYVIRPLRAQVGSVVDVLKGSGPLLGDLPNPEFKVHTVPLSSQESYIFLTDGLLAPESPSGEAFGYRRFLRLLRGQGNGDPLVVRNAVLNSIAAYSSEERLHDDQALLVLKCR
jgi:phosphoserine phosphatase RsbU/P